MTRGASAILLLTICIVIWNLSHRPKSRLVQTDYCPVDTKAAAKDEMGNFHIFWTKMYRPCSELDRYEQA